MYAARVKKTLEFQEGAALVPVVIRKLSAKSLDKAREAKRAANAEAVRIYGGDVIRAIREESRQSEAAAGDGEQKAQDPAARYDEFDQAATLVAGIESWGLKDESGAPVPTTDPAAVLDEETATTIFRAIIDLSVPTVADAVAMGKDA